MITSCKITRRGAEGEPYLDEETGEYVYPYELITVFEGQCSIRLEGLNVKSIDAQSQLLTVQKSILSLPIDGTGDVQANDTLTVTANPLDSALTGKVFRVEGIHAQTYATARRFSIERTS
jgi:hypothetical protein